MQLQHLTLSCDYVDKVLKLLKNTSASASSFVVVFFLPLSDMLGLDLT